MSKNIYGGHDKTMKHLLVVLAIVGAALAPARKLAAQALYTGDGGKGIVIAVPAPVMPNPTAQDNWAPQVLQDLLTGSLARCSAMTVVDRSNQDLAVAEQKNAENDLFSDEVFASIGNMTNAQYVLAAKIQKTSARYTVTARINHIETNEIKASFQGAFSLGDIESGKAAGEIAAELLPQMGVVLTPAGKEKLLGSAAPETKAVKALAQGMAAEKGGDIIEALAFYVDALEANPKLEEAATRINFDSGIPAGGIKARAAYAQTQRDKWQKIFSDLKTYVYNNLFVIVYDFDVIADEFNVNNNLFYFTVTPGIKFVPVRKTLLIWKNVLNTWNQVKSNPENETWIKGVSPFDHVDGRENTAFSDYTIQITCGLHDEYGDAIKSARLNERGINAARVAPWEINSKNFQVIAQKKYYDNAAFYPIKFDQVPYDQVTDTMSVRIDAIEFVYNRGNYKLPLVINIQEYAQWEAP